jgi:monothiol glutaredoxin
VAILDHVGAPYHTVDVLQDPEIRAGIKDFSQWPTIPQLYVKGEFLGGSDIMMEMYEAGELQALVTEKGITAKA